MFIRMWFWIVIAKINMNGNAARESDLRQEGRNQIKLIEQHVWKYVVFAKQISFGRKAWGKMKNVWLVLIIELVDNGIWMWFELFLEGKYDLEECKGKRKVSQLGG